MTKLIAILTSILVLIVAAMSFALSYHALQGVALANGLPTSLSYVWPLLIDFALVVFSLCVVTAHLYSESTWRQWALVIGCSIATSVYNYLHAPANLIAQSVAVVPPVMLFFSFELLMMQLKNSIKRQGLQSSATELSAMVEGYNTQLTLLQAKLAQVSQQLSEVQKQSQRVSDETTTGRREQIKRMKGEGVTQKQMAELLGVSISTVRNDIKQLSVNGNGR